MSRRFGGKIQFDVELDERLNHDSPLAVDFVVVYDKDLYAELRKKGASEWFRERDLLRRDNEPEKLEVRSWEWVPPAPCLNCPPGEPETVRYRSGARGAIVFADYFNSPGPHRVVIEPLRAFTLELGETELRVVLEVGSGPQPVVEKKEKGDKKGF